VKHEPRESASADAAGLGGSSLALNSAILAAQPFVLSVLSVFAVAYVIRTLGPAEYGRWATAAALTGATGIMSNLGLRPMFVRALAERPDDRAALLANQLALRLALGAATAIASVIAAVLLGYSRTVVGCAVMFGVALILATLWTVFGDYLQAGERFKTFAAVNFVAGLILTLLSVVSAWAGGGAIALAAAYVSGPLITAVAFGIVLYRRDELTAPRISWSEARALIRESRSIAGAQLLASLRDRSEQLMLPKAVGEGVFGVFAGSLMPADRLNMLPEAVATVLYPRMSRGGDDRHSSVTQLMVIVAIVASGAGAMLYMGAPLIAALLMPSHASLALLLVRWTAVGVPAAGLATGFTYALQATGSHRAAARGSAAVSAVSLVITIAGVFVWGAPGAAVAWVVRQYLLAAALAVPFVRQFRIPAASRRLCGALAILGVAVRLLSGSEAGFVMVTGRASAVLTIFLLSLAALRVAAVGEGGFDANPPGAS